MINLKSSCFLMRSYMIKSEDANKLIKLP